MFVYNPLRKGGQTLCLTPFTIMTDPEKKPYWRDALLVFSRMSGWIVAPVVIALFLGKWLDSRFGTAPLLFVITTSVSFIISMIGVVREGKRYMSKAAESKNTENIK